MGLSYDPIPSKQMNTTNEIGIKTAFFEIPWQFFKQRFLKSDMPALFLTGMSDDLCGSVRWWREYSGVCHRG